MADNTLLSLKYDRASNRLEVLDQLLVPHQRVMIDVPDCEAAWSVIREMQVKFTPRWRGMLELYRVSKRMIARAKANAPSIAIALA
jgi:hypothetical protein